MNTLLMSHKLWSLSLQIMQYFIVTVQWLINQNFCFFEIIDGSLQNRDPSQSFIAQRQCSENEITTVVAAKRGHTVQRVIGISSQIPRLWGITLTAQRDFIEKLMGSQLFKKRSALLWNQEDLFTRPNQSTLHEHKLRLISWENPNNY
jgi:hypothetical protein